MEAEKERRLTSALVDPHPCFLYQDPALSASDDDWSGTSTIDSENKEINRLGDPTESSIGDKRDTQFQVDLWKNPKESLVQYWWLLVADIRQD